MVIMFNKFFDSLILFRISVWDFLLIYFLLERKLIFTFVLVLFKLRRKFEFVFTFFSISTIISKLINKIHHKV